MKKLSIMACLIIAGTLSLTATAAKPLPLIDALRQKTVELTISGVGSNRHAGYQTSFYGKCIRIKIKNNTKRKQSLLLEPGYRLVSEESSRQDMVVTENLLFALNPSASRELIIYAMCAQQHDMSPNEKTRFRLGKMSTGPLRKIAAFIFAKKYQSNMGQQAVWCITDGNSMYNISGNDTAQVKDLQGFVKEVIPNSPAVKKVVKAAVIKPPVTPAVYYQAQGMFDFTITEPWSSVTIRLLDNQGKQVKVWIKGVSYRKGHYVEQYDFSTRDVPAGNYIMEVNIDGVVAVQRKIKLGP